MKAKVLLAILMGLIFSGCKKDWLDLKSDKKLTVPVTIADLQALLDNPIMNSMSNGIQVLAETGADNYYLTDQSFDALLSNIRYQMNAYIFAEDIFEGANNVNVWNLPYQRIYYANVVLDELPKLDYTPADQGKWNTAAGIAYFIRAYNHAQLAEVFQIPYNSSTAGTDLGVPLRLSSDFSIPTTRSSIKAVFDQITSDLLKAAELLPATTQTVTRPSKATAYALLARISLNMGNYADALKYANESLQRYSQLLDFNTEISPGIAFPLKRFNKEVLYQDVNSNAVFSSTRHIVDTFLFRSYGTKDIRRSAFFSGSGNVYRFKGNYDGTAAMFCGIATDEVYLIQAEAYARTNEVPQSLSSLNTLLRKRYTDFIDLTAGSSGEALTLILQERRKELCFRGLRWQDLRRLNKFPQFAVTIQRTVKNKTYTLLPNSNRYAYLIPVDIIAATGIEQNNRK